MSTALGLLQLHCHGPRKPQSLLRYQGGAAGCCRKVLARMPACPGGDEPQKEVTAMRCQKQAELLLHKTWLPARKSSCYWPVCPPPLSQLPRYCLQETQISIPKWTRHSRTLHWELLLIPIHSSSLINKPRLQITWPGTSFSTTHHWLHFTSLSPNLALTHNPVTKKEARLAFTVNYDFRNEITIKQDEPRYRRSCLHVYFLDYNKNSGAHKQAGLFGVFFV